MQYQNAVAVALDVAYNHYVATAADDGYTAFEEMPKPLVRVLALHWGEPAPYSPLMLEDEEECPF